MPNPGEICAQVSAPGYRIVFSTPTPTYTFHTDQTGKTFRWANSSPDRET